MTRRTTGILLLLILSLAAALRLHGITRQSLWADEVLTHLIAQKSVPDLVRDVTAYEQIPPVHHLIVHFWMKLFGDSELSLRFPSAIAGVAAVGGLYVLVRRLRGEAEALIAALLLAVSPFNILYSQEARAYALLVLMAIVCAIEFVKLMEDPSPRRCVFYALAGGLLLYTHLYGAFALLAFQVAYVVAWRRGPAPPVSVWIAAQLGVIALFAPWVAKVLKWMRSVGINFWVQRVTWDDATVAYKDYTGSALLLAIFVALVVLGVRRIARQHRASLPPAETDAAPAGARSLAERPAVVLALLLSLLFLPVIVPVAVSVWRKPVFSPRYGIIATIGLCPLAAAGLRTFSPCILRAAVIIAMVVLSAVARPVEPFKAHWREAADYLAEHMRPGDLAAVHIKASVRQYDYYVRRLRPDVPRVSFDGSAIPVTLPLDPPDRHVWLVLYGRFVPPRDILARGHWRVVSHKFFWDQIYIWELVSEPPATTREGNGATKTRSRGEPPWDGLPATRYTG